jgi:Domain of unknown function (DUF4326)
MPDGSVVITHANRNHKHPWALSRMSLDVIKPKSAPLRRPKRVQRSRGAKADPNVVDVGPGTKWANPIKRPDVETLVSSEPDIARAFDKGGWKLAALVLYRDHLLEKGLDPSELQGKDLSCTCKVTDPCHADVLIELANA